MKKIALALIASAFTFGAFAQSAPVAPEAGANAHMVKTAAKHKKTTKKHMAKKHAAKSTT